MTRSGGCMCGAVRYAVEGEPVHNAICHCSDCRGSAGAPMVAWLAVKAEQFTQTSGEVTTYTGKTGSQRQFCPKCGTACSSATSSSFPGWSISRPQHSMTATRSRRRLRCNAPSGCRG